MKLPGPIPYHRTHVLEDLLIVVSSPCCTEDCPFFPQSSEVIVTVLCLGLDMSSNRAECGSCPIQHACPLLDSHITFSEAWRCASSKALDTRKVSVIALIPDGRMLTPRPAFHQTLHHYFPEAEAKGLVFPLHALTNVIPSTEHTFCLGSQ